MFCMMIKEKDLQAEQSLIFGSFNIAEKNWFQGKSLGSFLDNEKRLIKITPFSLISDQTFLTKKNRKGFAQLVVDHCL